MTMTHIANACAAGFKMSDIVFLYVTAPDAQIVKDIAMRLIQEKHAACVNILPEMRSIYEWEGSVEEATETPFLVKTTKAAAPGACALIHDLHPYDTPCIAALPVAHEGSSPEFLNWITQNTRNPTTA